MKNLVLFFGLIISISACNQSNKQTAQNNKDTVSAGKNSIRSLPSFYFLYVLMNEFVQVRENRYNQNKTRAAIKSNTGFYRIKEALYFF